jgi:hypothetical protein
MAATAALVVAIAPTMAGRAVGFMTLLDESLTVLDGGLAPSATPVLPGHEVHVPGS